MEQIKEIQVDQERKIQVFPQRDSYYELQEKNIFCNHYQLVKKFDSKEEAIAFIKTFDPTQNNNQWKIDNGLDYRLIKVQVFDEYVLSQVPPTNGLVLSIN